MHNPFPKRNQPSTRNLPKQNNHLHVIHPNTINRPIHNPPKRNRRGGACVPARTFAQRRFHTKNMRIVCGDFNDGCALAGRHGRAHRHRPYQTPLYIRVQSSQTISSTQTKHINKSPPHNNRGRKCIAHSRPLNSK